MRKSESIAKLALALAKAQKSFKPMERKSLNPDFNHSYADLAEVISATRDALSTEELSVMQFPGNDKEGLHIIV